MSTLLIFGLVCSTIVASIADTDNRQPAVHKRDVVGLSTGGSNIGGTPVIFGDAEVRQSNFNGFGGPGLTNRRRCPQCDSSVFPYCADKLFHDACCCTDPYQFPLPPKCQFADCAFLHANSCREHRLIANCCCSDEYRSLLRGNGKTLSDADLAVAGRIKMNQKL